jgi:hypothetical protein
VVEISLISGGPRRGRVTFFRADRPIKFIAAGESQQQRLLAQGRPIGVVDSLGDLRGLSLLMLGESAVTSTRRRRVDALRRSVRRCLKLKCRGQCSDRRD